MAAAEYFVAKKPFVAGNLASASVKSFITWSYTADTLSLGI